MQGLVSRVDETAIPNKCPLLQPVLQEQGSTMMTRSSRPLSLESMQQEFYLTDIKEHFDRCNICIAVKGDYVK